MYVIKWTEQAKSKVLELLTEYFQKHGYGESIMQSDAGQVNGLELLCTIADDILGEEGIIYDDQD